MDYSQYITELVERGVTVIPIRLSSPFALMMFLVQQQEFISPDINGMHGDGLVMGGFGAYANPSSFHHPEVRRLRQEIYTQLLPFFQEYGRVYGLGFLQMLFDRFCIRRKGTSPTRESWHRDITPHKPSNGIVLGGWINLDSNQDQYFSCLPGTHNGTLSTTSSGFVLMDPSLVNKSNKERIRVPPSHLILFHQDLVHEVYAVKSTIHSCRLFIGWSFTSTQHTLFPQVHETLDTQAVPEIPSGQIPPLFSKSHVNYHAPQVRLFLQNLRDVFVTHPRTRYGVYVREMISLREASTHDPSIYLFPVYTPSEREMYVSCPLFPK